VSFVGFSITPSAQHGDMSQCGSSRLTPQGIMLHFARVTKHFGTDIAVDDVDLHVE
jgi:hypothetical protein